MKYGFSEDETRRLVTNAVIGSGKLIKSSSKSLDELISDVSSKGGTTIAGLNALEENGFINAIEECFESCYKRSVELGNLK